ncbi:MAG TPA: M20/M25/M40 family metallo-hydrolase [Anaerovoracaceae bacterium]|nr:M20/M25/M40 family metallo-hydrolase [Bacillota bacterium]HRV33423.1 M20/M25/M40 family metallo-hydrolase [Anaerovoracaceae bacterium]
MISKKDTRSLLQQLVAIQSPYFQEDRIMDFVKEWFLRENLPAEIRAYHEAKVTDFHGKNVVLELKGSGQGPVIHINGHLDTVNLCQGWTRNPEGEIRGDRLYGVGALDMKSGCAAAMIALKEFRNTHETFKGKIKASFVSVEEGPYGMGTNALIESGFLDDVDFSVINEPSAGFNDKPFPDICLGARGGYGLEVEFFGKAAHAATPELGISAAKDAAAVIRELDHIEFKEDEHLGKGTCCVIAMEADGGACSVPDYAKIKLFRHIVRGEDEALILREIDEAVARANIRSTYRSSFREAPSEGSRGFMPYTVSVDEPLVKQFVDSVRSVSQKEPSYSYFQSIGDFNYLGTRIDAPALIFGASGENFHGKDEYAELESVYETAKILYDFLVRVLVD